ncbi:MAG: diguanylate cyclase [Leptolyngbyaceae cyanobacterium bins.59]|nr:diguanylate cyclase [Leptolyngbyaceae cyanobacterium bins.59]
MTILPDSFQKQLTALRETYTQQLLNKLQQIEDLWAERHVNWNNRTLAALHRMIHNLAGSGATFGFVTLSDRAFTLERFLRTIMEADSPLTLEEEAQVSALIAVLAEATQPDPLPSSRLDACLLSHPSPPLSKNNRIIFLVKEDPVLARDMMLQISYFGYTVRTFSNPSELRVAVNETIPAAIIVDLVSVDGGFAGTETIASIQHDREVPIPILFISVRSDLAARLLAVRAGGYAYFTKPVEISALIDKLDTLTAHQTPDPYRILIVEDEATLAAYYALTLEQAGMLTSLVTDPLHVMQPLIEFRPDLILMDIYMPSCTGLELAAVIRQLEAYVSIPIVYLSMESNVDKQLIALSLGGDDFLMKPIHPDHLVKSVTSRAQRSRILRSFMIRDSLTGLLNHTKTKEQLAIELSRAQRQNLPLAFAMIDIDRFKSVNDTYGHTMGDRIIKSLARLLQQRLRKTDCIGRYGGEEFAVILPNTDGKTASLVLEELRSGFAQIRHQFTGQDFSVTFSCGVAEFPRCPDVASLSDAADRALYTAKSRGRNQVLLAGNA